MNVYVHDNDTESNMGDLLPLAGEIWIHQTLVEVCKGFAARCAYTSLVVLYVI